MLDLTGLDRILEVDAARRRVRVQAGVTYAALLAELVPRGLMLPVIPGTRHVTLGGAIASDVHGKNHPHDGSIGRHVLAAALCALPGGALRSLDSAAEGDRELLLATLGGMGLTGVVVEATLAVEPLRRAVVVARHRPHRLARRHAGADGARRGPPLLGRVARPARARGARLGRAVVTRSRRLAGRAGPARSAERARARAPAGGRALAGAARLSRARCSQPPLIAAFNELRWRRFPRRERGRPVALPPHFFPLDGFGDVEPPVRRARAAPVPVRGSRRR